MLCARSCAEPTIQVRTIVRNLLLVLPPAYSPAMARRYAADDLVGVAEIAERLDVGTSVVHDWRYQHSDFAQPVARRRMGLIWAWTAVRAWPIQTGRPR